jgi:hypothetical protein
MNDNDRSIQKMRQATRNIEIAIVIVKVAIALEVVHIGILLWSALA